MKLKNVFLVAALSCLLATPAFADPTPEEMKKAEALFVESERLYKTGDYQKALDGYKQAYFLTEIPDFLYNMAQCQRQLENYEAALDLYRSYLRDVPGSPIQPQVEQIIVEIEPLAKEQKAKAAAAKSPGSDKFKEALPSLVLPGGLFLGWVAFGVTARAIDGRIQESGVASPLFYNVGRGAAIASDLALIATGVTLYLALKPKSEKAAAVSFAPLSRGGALVFTFIPGSSK